MWFQLSLLMMMQSITGLQEVKVAVPFQLTLEKPAEVVYLAGTFNHWQFRQHPMKSEDGGRTWRLTLELPPGLHQYKFVVNGTEWLTDPKAAQNVEDGFGNLNSVLWVEPAGYGFPARRSDSQITRSAILHEPDNLRGRNPDGKRLILTLRARQNDVAKVEVEVAEFAQIQIRTDRRLSPSATLPMKLLFEDGLFAYYRVQLPNRKCAYRFRLTDGTLRLWLSPAGLSEQEPSRFFEHDPAHSRTLNPPGWMQNAIFYHLLPDSFFNGDKTNDPPVGKPLDHTGRTDLFNGGDLNGIVQKFDYLQQLGVNALYLNPVFASVSHHNYDTDDYERIDPQLGGEEAFQQLVARVKASRMRLVLDGAFNHVGINFFAFRDLLQNQQNSRYKEWFYIERFPIKVQPRPNYWAWWGLEYMPKLNTENPEVRDYLLRIVTRWMKKVPFDGWRLDVANEVPDSFWRAFRKVVKAANPEAVIIGEIWDNANHWLQGDLFDSVMNYRWRAAVLEWIAHRRILPSQFDRRIQAILIDYPRQAMYSLYNMLSSHDTPRLRTECEGDWSRVRLAFLLQMTAPGAPAIYYGDEIGMEGGAIPDNRRPMEWNPSPEGKALREYVKQLIRLRRSLPVLRQGEWQTLLVDDPQNVYAYSRSTAHSFALIVVNNGTQPATVEIALPFKTHALKVAFSTQPAGLARLAAPNQRVRLTLPPMSGFVLVPEFKPKTSNPNSRRLLS